MAGQLIRAVTPLTPDDALSKAVHQFRQHPLPAIPVVEDAHLVGWVTERRVTEYMLARGDASMDARVIEVLEPIPAAVVPHTPLDDAAHILLAGEEALLPVITEDGHYLGCLLRADVAAARAGRLAPARIGGMATPLGVYLTTGAVSGGVGSLALVLTGVTMAALFWFAQQLLILLSAALFQITDHVLFRDLVRVLDPYQQYGGYSQEQVLLLQMLSAFLLLTVFLLLLRAFPRLTGYHAAEHQTVNAIEAGEPLTPEAVGRMPRVHPRCGTNLWAIIILLNIGLYGLFLGFVTHWGIKHQEVVLSLVLPYGVFVFMTWRRLGGWLQRNLTTRPARRDELESGIRAGKEVIRRHLYAPRTPPTLAQRLWQMGLAQVAAGLIGAGMLLQYLRTPLDAWWQTLVQ